MLRLTLLTLAVMLVSAACGGDGSGAEHGSLPQMAACAADTLVPQHRAVTFIRFRDHEFGVVADENAGRVCALGPKRSMAIEASIDPPILYPRPLKDGIYEGL